MVSFRNLGPDIPLTLAPTHFVRVSATRSGRFECLNRCKGGMRLNPGFGFAHSSMVQSHGRRAVSLPPCSSPPPTYVAEDEIVRVVPLATKERNKRLGSRYGARRGRGNVLGMSRGHFGENKNFEFRNFFPAQMIIFVTYWDSALGGGDPPSCCPSWTHPELGFFLGQEVATTNVQRASLKPNFSDR